jgi:DNA-binding protein YbaB
MDPAIDIKQRITDQIAQVTRQYMDNQRSQPGAVGRSQDGSVAVTLDGLGDVTDVRIDTEDVPAETATKLAAAFRQAWMDAGRQVALAAAKDNPLTERPGIAELVEEQIDQRYGTPAEPHEDDESFGEDSPLR